MKWHNDAQGWGLISRLLHWTTAGLVLYMLGLGVYMSRVDDVFRQFELFQHHKSVGVVVIVLTLLRLAWRTREPLPPALGDKAWEHRAAATVHRGFYGLLILMPISGYLMASASPLEIPTVFFGLVELPHLVEPSERLETLFFTIHYSLAIILALGIALHVTAAFKHHFIDRDGTLRRMITGHE